MDSTPTKPNGCQSLTFQPGAGHSGRGTFWIVDLDGFIWSHREIDDHEKGWQLAKVPQLTKAQHYEAQGADGE